MYSGSVSEWVNGWGFPARPLFVCHKKGEESRRRGTEKGGGYTFRLSDAFLISAERKRGTATSTVSVWGGLAWNKLKEKKCGRKKRAGPEKTRKRKRADRRIAQDRQETDLNRAVGRWLQIVDDRNMPYYPGSQSASRRLANPYVLLHSRLFFFHAVLFFFG